MDTIVIATRNPAKVERYQRLLANFVPNIIGLDFFGEIQKPLELEGTAEGNAVNKAKYYVRKIGLPVFSEDEALHVDFLPKDKQPGVHVRRIHGKEEASDKTLFNYWESLVRNAPEEKRTGYWRIAYCIALPSGEVYVTTLDHRIRFFYPASKVVIPGWPLSSLEGAGDFGKPHSDFTSEERAKLEEITTLHVEEKLGEIFKKM